MRHMYAAFNKNTVYHICILCQIPRKSFEILNRTSISIHRQYTNKCNENNLKVILSVLQCKIIGHVGISLTTITNCKATTNADNSYFRVIQLVANTEYSSSQKIGLYTNIHVTMNISYRELYTTTTTIRPYICESPPVFSTTHHPQQLTKIASLIS